MTGAERKKARPGRQIERRQPGGGPLFRRLPWFGWLAVGLAVAGIVVAVVILSSGQPPLGGAGKPRAAIVDQLYNLQPNEAFVEEVTRQLQEYGFEVDLYQGDEVTVDFYRGLARRGHKLIIFRVHSGLVIENGEVLPRTLLFTNEDYSATRYPGEQLSDRLGKGSAGEGHPMMFGITAGFVTNTRSMPGRFSDTVIIMMGCSAIFYTDLAEAFVDRGASVYLGWHGSVVLHYVDEATPYLMQQLCSQNATIQEAVDSTMEVIGLDPRFLAELRYYPPGQGDKTLQELLQLVVEDDNQDD